VSGGIEIHGSICRLRTDTPRSPEAIQIVWFDASRSERGRAVALLSQNGLKGRGLGCGYYRAALNWAPGDFDTLRIQPVT
jgi:hypothetical protein